MSRMLSAVLLLAFSSPALAQTAGSPASDAPAAAKAAKPEKKICRFYDTTGSIMTGSKVCHTKTEWASIDGTNSRTVTSVNDPRGRYGGSGTRLGD